MHKADSVIGAILCVGRDGFPEGDWELDQYLQASVSPWRLRENERPFTFSSLPNDIESIAEAMRGCS